MVALDPRINPFRPEIAAKYLQGQVEAARFVEGARHEVVEPIAALRRAPSHEARLDTEALMGERVIVYETTDEGWAWGQLETDGYVGWLSANALGAPGPRRRPTRLRCRARSAFPGPTSSCRRSMALPMGARLAIARQDERFAVTADGWHLPARASGADQGAGSRISSPSPRNFSARPICGAARPRSASTARGWCRSRCKPPAIACPRDSDMQELALGKLSSLAELRRGDLVFWKGHVAIARDGETLAARQCASHGGGDRAGGGGDRAHQGGGQRGHQREAALGGVRNQFAQRGRD